MLQTERPLHRASLSLSIRLTLVAALIGVAVVGRAGAQDSTASEGVTVGGLVVNETRTALGRDFYDVFYRAWTPPEDVTSYTVRIQEQPLPNLGSRVQVFVEDALIFQTHLRPRYEVIEHAGRKAAQRTHTYLAQQYEPRDVY